jgi:EAL and modified HD-GYP domain-containing signal transduction protein
MDHIQNQNGYSPFFVARQPIFFENGQIWGYELLFRSGPGYDIALMDDEDIATFSVATCGFIRSQEDIDQTKKICINFTEKLLMQGSPQGLPPAVTVIEVLENVLPSDRVIEMLIRYKQQGYQVAIDDFVGSGDIKDLLDLADIIKVDVLNKSIEEIERICRGIENNKAIKIAEKVEDKELLGALKSLGFTLFQGYYFAKPELLSGRKIDTTNISRLRVLQAIEDPSVTPEKVEKVIAADPSITYRLLRFLNSAAFGFSVRIKSIRQAIVLMGVKRLKNWLRMVILSDLMGSKNPELYVMALNRGKILEELAATDQISGDNADTLFLFGLLSMLEAMLDTPMVDLVKRLPIPDEIAAGYIVTANKYNKYLQLLAALERSIPEDIRRLCNELEIEEDSLAEASVRSILWANKMQRDILQ